MTAENRHSEGTTAMRRSLVFLAVLAWAGPALPADPWAPPPDLAARAWAITDAVLAHHIDPPARQQMLLSGVKVVNKAGHAPSEPGLARRVSGVETPEQLAAILAETWPRLVRTDEGPKPEDHFLEGVLAAVPGGAELLSPNQLKVAEQMEGNVYVGIQVALSIDGESKRPTFDRVLEGGPAQQAGAKAGDRIEAIDGIPTEGMAMVDVVDRIRGPEGTEVLIRLRKKDAADAVDVPIRRGRLPRKTVEGLSTRAGGGWEVLLPGPAPIGYLKVAEIAGSTPQEVRAFAAQLEAEGARALVLDLREANQAAFHPTVLLADALLDGGTIGRVRGPDSDREIKAEPDALFRDWPIAVLAGKLRSPEVAWLCDALEDNHRATILGRPQVAPASAVVRTAVPIPGGDWSLRIATGRLERGDGRPLGAPPLDIRRRAGQVESLAVMPLDPYAAESDPAAIGRVPRRSPGGTPADTIAAARTLLEAALKTPGP